MDREWRSSCRIDSMVEPSRVENWGEEEVVVVLPDGGDGVFAMVEYLVFCVCEESRRLNSCRYLVPTLLRRSNLSA